MHSVTLLTGSNDPQAEDILLQARRLLAQSIGAEEAASQIYRSAAWGFESESIFCNQALRLGTHLTPEQVLDVAQEVEQTLGRRRDQEQQEKERTGQRYASRRVDVDIMFYDNEVISTPRLSVPHPLMQERAFALEPLCEIEPERLHPVLGRRLSDIYEDLKQRTKQE
jgi:2-amino-4-hydroxy-6-hydroxymethyldihydropteridine diphosphokinase